jgi:hypothetical protein
MERTEILNTPYLPAKQDNIKCLTQIKGDNTEDELLKDSDELDAG